MSLQLNKTNCFKFLITFFCKIGFTYHTISLIEQYLSGKTVVNLFIGTLFKEGLPAITICPEYYAIDKIANLSVPLKRLYQDYVTLNISSENYKLKKKNTFLKAAKYIKDMFRNNELNIGNIFYNYSGHYHEKPNIIFGAWETDYDLKRLFNQSTITMVNGIDYYQVNPIESITMYHAMWKCYTFFSHLDPIWKNADIDFKDIQILVQLDQLSYPYMSWPLMIFFHSPNDIPIHLDGKVIKTLFNIRVPD